MPRDAEAFRQRLEVGKRHLVELATSIGRSSFEALQAYRQLVALLKDAVSPTLRPAASEVREQAQRLIYPGFISATPPNWLPHLGRYLQAAIRRLEKVSGNSQRDGKQSALVRRYQHAYEQAVASSPENKALGELRWLIEELRVSLFAQQLGTSVKISPERLDRLFKELD